MSTIPVAELRAFEEIDPRSSGFSQTGHPLLRHHHPAERQTRLRALNRSAFRAFISTRNRSGAGDGSTWIYLRARGRLPAECGVYSGPQAGQAARRYAKSRLCAGVRDQHSGNSHQMPLKRPTRHHRGRPAGHGWHRRSYRETGRFLWRGNRGPGICRRTRFSERPRQT